MVSCGLNSGKMGAEALVGGPLGWRRWPGDGRDRQRGWQGVHGFGRGASKGAWCGACYAWFMGRSRRARVKWGIAALGLMATSCAGFVGAGAAAVLVGAGAVGFTCYDRVSVTVTDAVTGTPLCDAKVTFIEGTSTITATSCYEAALSRGKYRLRVERRGLVPYEESFEVTKGDGCGQSVQTMYVALDRLNHAPAPPAAPPQVVVAPQNGTVLAPSAAAPAPPSPPASASVSAPALAPPPTPPGSAPARASGPAPAPPGSAPATTAFPEAL